ncbi:MAG: hypothetical protein JNM69_26925 [Archangium sp.]|nr:hypothetical protein [Archangium sp.]
MTHRLLVLLLLPACGGGTWAVEGDRFQKPTACDFAASYDVLARGTVVSAGPARKMLFSAWPQSYVWETPLVVELERDLRGALPPGRHSMLVGAPVRNGRLATLQTTGIGDGRVGWLFAVKLDDSWVMAHDGVLISSDPSRFVSPVMDESYDSEADFERALTDAMAKCPRASPSR